MITQIGQLLARDHWCRFSFGIRNKTDTNCFPQRVIPARNWPEEPHVTPAPTEHTSSIGNTPGGTITGGPNHLPVIALIRSPAVFACGERGYSFLDLAVILDGPIPVAEKLEVIAQLEKQLSLRRGVLGPCGRLDDRLGLGRSCDWRPFPERVPPFSSRPAPKSPSQPASFRLPQTGRLGSTGPGVPVDLPSRGKTTKCRPLRSFLQVVGVPRSVSCLSER